VPTAPGLPQPTVAQYRATPYQWPADARAISPAPVGLAPANYPVAPQPWAAPPAVPQPQYAQPPLAQPQLAQPPPASWVPSAAPPPPGLQPQAAAPPPNGGWGAAPAVAAATAPFAAAALATQPNPGPTSAAAPPPVAPIPNVASQPAPATPAQPASSGGLAPVASKSAPASNTHVWKVVGVHDGDTVTCIDENNQQQKIRLAEIDAPEVSQDYGKVSREALAGMVFGKTIQVVDDGRDRYGRWIGHLFVDGVDVNRQMVATGMAWHYAAYSKDASLGSLQSQAQAQKLGLWAQPNPTPPWDYRKNGKKNAA
jgi:endonuclease YncB( thermonuclease family)